MLNLENKSTFLKLDLFWEIPEYNIFIDGENVNEMSYGQRQEKYINKKFKSFIENNNDKKIIMIDQPENDLDSQTIKKAIMENLININFSKQIIIATHEPIIAINSDHQTIIVADFKEGHNSKGFYSNYENKLTDKRLHKIIDGGKWLLDTRFQEYGGIDNE